MFNIIDIFDRIIVDYHMGFHCEARDAAALLKYALIKRNLYGKETVRPVIRTDNGPQFVSYRFKEFCEELGLYHERIPVKTPNKNAYVESSHRILEDECFKINEFKAMQKHMKQ